MENTVTKKNINKNWLEMIILISLFNFLFLGSEYLFDNMIAKVANPSKVVIAQSYVLGASVVGFVLYPIIKKILDNKTGIKNTKNIAVSLAIVLGCFCVWKFSHSDSYNVILMCGCLLFIILGAFGSTVFYFTAINYGNSKYLGKTIGFAYGFGLLIQFVSNNLIKSNNLESVSIVVLWVAAIIIVQKISGKSNSDDRCDNAVKEKGGLKNNYAMVILLIAIVVLMANVFTTLDNVVTLFHADGTFDVGQYPRLFLAVSGIVAGILFDIKKGRFMYIIMYCITLLSTICILTIVSGGAFLTGLLVFYLSAGFFAVFFTTAFVKISLKMENTRLWAGMGRAVNNLMAVLMGSWSLKLYSTENVLLITVLSLVLFVAISVLIFLYTMKNIQINRAEIIENNWDNLTNSEKEINSTNETDKLQMFSENFSLTKREKEVLEALLNSDDSVQNIAAGLYISRAALYRHISNINKKTDTNSRVGLIKFYYTWTENTI